MADSEKSKEEHILQAVKSVLTQVVKDTATPPGMKHPLNDDTILAMRECLRLISDREQELAKHAGRELNMRPRFTDEPQAQTEVVIPLHKTGLSKPSTNKE